MASEIEYINIKDYIAGLSTTENPSSSDKGIVSNPTNGPRAVPASPDALTTTATEADLVDSSIVKIKTLTGWKRLLGSFLKPLSSLKLVDNEEYLYAITDMNDAFLFGIRTDGSVEWAKGIPEPIQSVLDNIVTALAAKVDKVVGKGLVNSVFADGVSVSSTDNHLLVVKDSEGRVLLSVDRTGKVEQISELEEIVQRKIAGKSVVDEIFAEGVSVTTTDEYLLVIVDKNGKIVFSVNKHGKVEQIENLAEITQRKIAGKSVIDEIFADGVSVTTQDGYLFVITDKDGRAVLSVKDDGTIEQIQTLASAKVDKELRKGLIDSLFAEGVSVGRDADHLLLVTDSQGRVLFEIDNNGHIPQIDNLLKDKVDKKPGFALAPKFVKDLFSLTSDADHLLVLSDADGRVILDITKDGKIEITKNIDSVVYALSKKVDKEHGKSLIDSKFSGSISYEAENYLQVVVDSIGRYIAGIKSDGSFEFGTKANFTAGVNWSADNLTELQEALAANGVDLSGKNLYDWSDKPALHIGVPRLAIANIKMSRSLPQYKGDEVNAEIEFWDLNGNYFTKKIVMDVQGNSTQWYPKKNYAIDICNDNWVGDDTFSLKFGNWVEQDSYHLKAWWVDMFRGCGQSYYNLLTDIWKYKRGVLNKPWLKAKISSDRLTNRGFGCSYDYEPEDLDLRLDTGATCHPEGFPLILHYNGEFLGIYSWAIKKHRKNYHMDKKTYEEVLIDGVLFSNEFWNGVENIDWTSFELKNPKTLITMDGEKYDGDNPVELIDNTSPYWDNSKNQKNTQKTKNYIKALSNVMPLIREAVDTYGVDSQEVIDLYNTYFDVDNLIDYILFSDVILDTDTGANNVLWATWDGVKWFACPYDIDRILGIWGGYCTGNQPNLLLSREGYPTYYIGLNSTFRSRLVARYAELRDGGIFSVDNLISYCTRWVDAIGFDNYEKEFERWPNNLVNNNSVVNSTYWEIDSSDIQQTGTWDATTEYAVGDVVYYGAGNVSGYGSVCGYYKFTCLQPNTNQRPFTELRCRDSLWRLYSWLTTQIDMMDSYYNYNP